MILDKLFDFSSLVTLASTLLGGFLIFPPQAKIENNTCYDYVIVGGGTAGCVLARRLAEQNCSVLLLEAGGNPNAVSMAPGVFFLEPKTSIDYDYQSTYNPYAAGSQGNYTRLTSGKALGGSSVLNHLLHIRPPPADFDRLAEITNDDSWAYDNFLEYFKKSENMTDEEIAQKYGNYHGVRGPVGTVRLNSTDINDAPVINTGFYSDSKDLDRFVNIILDFTKFVDSPTMAKLGAEIVVDEKCAEDKEVFSVDYWRCYILRKTLSPFLYLGTCPIGSVVDTNLKVIGFNKLRVVDASVFPELLRGAFNSAVIALAEKMADQILNENGACNSDGAC
ncbi:hypothetical protein PYW07_010935 [Mythimna separata]|uniref:Uncharacterized protein n=1 Tax=Mythimna separata TaxID=271217 RepID=A0AAD8DLC3_MYTSE|nr:hypothetical protein PYW07_010935 [Mythimna separata]